MQAKIVFREIDLYFKKGSALLVYRIMGNWTDEKWKDPEKGLQNFEAGIKPGQIDQEGLLQTKKLRRILDFKRSRDQKQGSDCLSNEVDFNEVVSGRSAPRKCSHLTHNIYGIIQVGEFQSLPYDSNHCRRLKRNPLTREKRIKITYVCD